MFAIIRCFLFLISRGFVQVRPNAVRLRMPVWITDLQFVDERNRCLVVTGHHQIRLYDPQSSARRPVHDIDFEQSPIMSLALLHSSNNQYVYTIYKSHLIVVFVFFSDIFLLEMLKVKWRNSISNVYHLHRSCINTEV